MFILNEKKALTIDESILISTCYCKKNSVSMVTKILFSILTIQKVNRSYFCFDSTYICIIGIKLKFTERSL